MAADWPLPREIASRLVLLIESAARATRKQRKIGPDGPFDATNF
jgi:hypothetical protein